MCSYGNIVLYLHEIQLFSAGKLLLPLYCVVHASVYENRHEDIEYIYCLKNMIYTYIIWEIHVFPYKNI